MHLVVLILGCKRMPLVNVSFGRLIADETLSKASVRLILRFPARKLSYVISVKSILALGC